MSNQRPGNYQKRPDIGMSDMNTKKFFTIAKKELMKAGKEDEAFYFEQIEDWLVRGKSLPLDEENVIKALGI